MSATTQLITSFCNATGKTAFEAQEYGMDNMLNFMVVHRLMQGQDDILDELDAPDGYMKEV